VRFGPVELGVLGALGLLGLAVCAWVFWPAFKGAEAARQAIGTHRLAVGGLISVLVLNAALTIPLAPYLQRDGAFTMTTTTFVLAALSTDIPMLLFVFGRLIAPGAVNWRDLGFVPKRPDYVLRMGLGGGLAGLVVVDIIGTLLSQIGLRSNQLEQFEFVLNEGPLAFVLLLIAAGVVAPVVEELFFRGFLFGLYRRRQPLWVAYLASGVLFTLLHLDPTRMNLAQMAGLSVGIFLLATLLAWLYQHTGSLYPGIVAHAVNNTTGLLLFYALGVR
jgi:membrane protease YdiL (CAAX protease family)